MDSRLRDLSYGLEDWMREDVSRLDDEQVSELLHRAMVARAIFYGCSTDESEIAETWENMATLTEQVPWFRVAYHLGGYVQIL